MSLLDGFRKKIVEPAMRSLSPEPSPAPVAEPPVAADMVADAASAEPSPAEVPVAESAVSEVEEAEVEAVEVAAAEETPVGEDRDDQDLHDEVVAVLKTVYDPEIPVDIYELGLIYEVDVRQGNVVYVQMTLTSPMCPVAESLPIEVEAKVRTVAGVGDVDLELVWEPPWSMDMMSEAAKLELNML